MGKLDRNTLFEKVFVRMSFVMKNKTRDCMTYMKFYPTWKRKKLVFGASDNTECVKWQLYIQRKFQNAARIIGNLRWCKKWNKWILFKEWKMFVNLIDKHVEWQRNIHSDSERKWQKNKIFRELATCQWLYVHTLILIDFSHEVMWLLFLAFIFFLCLWEMNNHLIGSSHSIYVFVWIYDLLQLRGQWWWHRTNLQNVVLSVLFSLSMGW